MGSVPGETNRMVGAVDEVSGSTAGSEVGGGARKLRPNTSDTRSCMHSCFIIDDSTLIRTIYFLKPAGCSFCMTKQHAQLCTCGYSQACRAVEVSTCMMARNLPGCQHRAIKHLSDRDSFLGEASSPPVSVEGWKHGGCRSHIAGLRLSPPSSEA